MENDNLEQKKILWIYHNFGTEYAKEEKIFEALEEFDKLHLELLSLVEIKRKYNIIID